MNNKKRTSPQNEINTLIDRTFQIIETDDLDKAPIQSIDLFPFVKLAFQKLDEIIDGELDAITDTTQLKMKTLCILDAMTAEGNVTFSHCTVQQAIKDAHQHIMKTERETHALQLIEKRIIIDLKREKNEIHHRITEKSELAAVEDGCPEKTKRLKSQTVQSKEYKASLKDIVELIICARKNHEKLLEDDQFFSEAYFKGEYRYTKQLMISITLELSKKNDPNLSKDLSSDSDSDNEPDCSQATIGYLPQTSERCDAEIQTVIPVANDTIVPDTFQTRPSSFAESAETGVQAAPPHQLQRAFSFREDSNKKILTSKNKGKQQPPPTVNSRVHIGKKRKAVEELNKGFKKPRSPTPPLK